MYDVERKEAIGYVHLRSQSNEFINTIYQIDRQDGLSESWYSGDHDKKSKSYRGYLNYATYKPFIMGM